MKRILHKTRERRRRREREERKPAARALLLPLLWVGFVSWKMVTSSGGGGDDGTSGKTMGAFSAPIIATRGNNNNSKSGFEAEAQRQPRRPHVFVDVGANCGNSYWKLKNNPNNGVLDSDDWETYLWECNPQMNKFFLRELAESDPSIHLIEKAASTEVRLRFQLFSSI